MPIPYGGSDTGVARALVALATVGKAAVASQGVGSTRLHDNAGPVVLSGSFQNLATDSFVVAASQKLIVTFSVAADVTSSGLSGHLDVDLLVGGVDSYLGTLSQSYATDATGSVLSYTFSFVPIPGTVTFALRARASGDGSLTAAAHKGTLLVQVAANTP
jgi:hypothetical protein